ncbi:MAG: hypothetical protein Q8K26_04255, partial [Candidatus Gracilibacteria bacterium]|nr:hypothetical protein [Candidatus Gracilibacteria bacterium]
MSNIESDKNWEIEEMKDALDKKLRCLSKSQKYNEAVFKILRISSDYSKIASKPLNFFTQDELEEEEIGEFVNGCKIIRLKMDMYNGKVKGILGGTEALGNQKEKLSKEEEEENERHKLFLLTYKKELEEIGLIEIDGIWYFDECAGWKKWPKIGEKGLSSFPSSKWNKKRGVGTLTGVIQNKDDLKEMFRNLGLNVATEEQELERYKNTLLSHKEELENIGLMEIDSIWYFSELQSKKWPKIGKNCLGNFPSATLNKKWGAGNRSGTIQNDRGLKIMFKELGLNVATEEQELERYKNLLLSHKEELKKIGLKEIRGLWYFYKCRGNQDWQKIGKLGK